MCSCSQQLFQPEHKTDPQSLRNDLSLLKKILETNHPGLYWYTPKDSINFFFNQTLLSLQDSLTEFEFRKKVSWVISKIRCGHTAVRSSKAYAKFYRRKRVPYFPLSLKAWNDSMVVVNNAWRNDSILKRGAIITGINGFSNSQLLDSMFQLTGTDGYADNFKQQLISFNFPFYYRSAFGADSQYVIHYVDSLKQPATRVIRNYVPKADSSKKSLEPYPRLTKKERRKYERFANRNMTEDTGLHTAILNINTFSEGHLKYFFRKSFRKIKEDEIKNVVIDLRENSGGDILSSIRLIQYLADRPFRIADTIAAINRSFPYKKYMKPWFIYWLAMHVTGRKYSDGRIHFRFFEQHYFKPKKRHHFNGNVYVITGGFTFSASSLVAGALKGQKNVTLVGEETGGGYYGNSAMHLPVVILPHSKLRVVLPLYRMVLDKDRPKNGRGVFPDVEVNPSSSAIKQGIDPKMEKVRELIKQISGL